MELEDLKKEYGKLARKYKLPKFSELDENFEVGKVDRESGILLKVVRKAMMEKIVNSMGFVEMLLNPMQAPKMYHFYIKTMTLEDKKKIEEIYLSFAQLSLVSLEREIDYEEKGEAKLISEIFSVWNKMKPNFKSVIGNIKNPSKLVGKKERSYFG